MNTPVDFRLRQEKDGMTLEACTKQGQRWLEEIAKYEQWRWLTPSRVVIQPQLLDDILTSLRRAGLTIVRDVFEEALANAKTFTLDEWRALNRQANLN
jgi:hypothetical protein